MLHIARWPAGTILAAVTVESLQEKIQALQAEVEAIIAKADEAEEDISEEDLKAIEAKKAEMDKIGKQIAAREAANITAASRGRKSAPEPKNGKDAVPAQPRQHDGKGGFKSFGEFSQLVRAAALDPGGMDGRIRAAAPTTSGSEAVGADGGFAVPPDFRQEIWQKVSGEESLLSRTNQLVTSANSITLPADETSPWQTSGGVQAFWESELGAISQSKPALQMKNIRLNKLTALVPVSEELLDDAPGLDGYLRTKAPQKMMARLNTAIVRGTGAGMPKGILESESLITQAAVGSQGAGTVIQANISAMWARMYSECRRNAVWLINQDVEPQLDVLAIPGTGSPVPLYMPSGGLSASPFSTLKGRPVIPVQACSTLGTVGDIILVDLTQYMSVTKGQDIKTDVSMHLYFDAAALAYRFIFRVSGQPWWAAAITPENGSNTLSWAVALSSSRT